MKMSKEGGEKGKVVVIQTSIDWSWNEMKWVVNALPLNPGDDLILLGVLQLINPSSSFLSAASKIWGYKGKDDPNKIIGSNRKLLEERRRKREEYRQNGGVMKLQEKLQLEKKVKVIVEIAVCSSCKVGAVRAIKRLGATWIILDREMKKDKQYFVDRVSCGISSMKSNNTIVTIREPINEHVSYDEMIPSYSGDDVSPLKEEAASCYSTTRTSQVSASSCTLPDRSETQPPLTSSALNTEKYQGQTTVESRKLKGLHKHFKVKEFGNTVCSVCNNRRPKIGCHKDFSYAELDEATNSFSDDNFLSEGGFGVVYRGKLKDGLEVAVKQHKAASDQGEKEFKSEVYVLSQVRHQNLVMLLGSCAQGTHRLLVYEYICNGSLEHNLSNASKPLNWEQRMKIARGAARGLAYLHEQNIVHRDVRPGNILITHDYEALLGDFGLAKAQQDDTANSSGVVGTLGYVAPEYAECGKMSNKTDVYSFGVVLLQLITGLRTTDEIDGGKSLVGWAKPLLESKNYPDLIDRRIVESHDVHQLFWMVLAAESCLNEDPDYRLTMEQVVNYLNCNKEVNANYIIDYVI